jgi:hypothetical protein
LWIALVLAGIAYFAGRIIDQGDGLFAAMSVGILVATIELVGVWSVFGTSGYLFRFGISHLAGLLVFAAFVFGMLISLSFNDYGPAYDKFLSTVWRAALVIPPLSASVQLPFWFFRAVFGWQFVAKGDKPGPSFALREIFTFTFIVALAFTTTQLFARLTVESYQYWRADDQTEVIEVVNEDGSISQVPETAAQTEERLNQMDRTMELTYLSLILSQSVVLFIVSVLAFPVLLFIFRPQEPAIGCLLSFVYAIAICTFVIAVFTLMTNGAAPPGEIFGLMAVGLFTAIGAGAVSLFVTRAQGFELTSPKRFEKRLLAIANDPKCVEAEKTEEK